MKKENLPTATETLQGFGEVTVTNRNGTMALVKVRQLPVRLYPEYSTKLDDEAALVEFVCEQPQGWADGLTADSFDTLVTEVNRINGDFFARWWARKMEQVERMSPGLMQRRLDALASPISAPKSA